MGKKSLPFCSPSNTEQCVVIGTDTFGTVYKTVVRGDCTLPALAGLRNQEIAIKVFTKTDKDCYDNEKRMYERLKELRISGIVPFYCGIQFGNANYICMKLCEFSLSHMLTTPNKVTIECFHNIHDTLTQTIGEMLRFDIAHRDIQPENILFAEGDFYLCDIGAMKKSPKCIHSDTYQSVGRYLHPDFGDDIEVIDYYSLGVTLVEVLESILMGLPNTEEVEQVREWFEALWTAHSSNRLSMHSMMNRLAAREELPFLEERVAECANICSQLLNKKVTNNADQLLCKLCKAQKMKSEFSISGKKLPTGEIINICSSCSDVLRE